MTSRPSRRVAWLLLLVAAALVAQLSVASAAKLSLDGPRAPSAVGAERCADLVQVSTPAARVTTAVRVEDIPAACAGLPVVVRVYSGSATSASVPVVVPSGGGAVALVVPQFSPTATHKAYVTIGGWPVSATWSYSPWSCVVVNSSGQPIDDRNCSVSAVSATTGVHRALILFWVTDRYATFNITTTHNAKSGERVRVTADLSTATGLASDWFAGTTNRGTSDDFGGNLDATMACSELPWLTAVSNASPGTTFTQVVRNNRNSLAWTLAGDVTCS